MFPGNFHLRTPTSIQCLLVDHSPSRRIPSMEYTLSHFLFDSRAGSPSARFTLPILCLCSHPADSGLNPSCPHLDSCYTTLTSRFSWKELHEFFSIPLLTVQHLFHSLRFSSDRISLDLWFPCQRVFYPLRAGSRTHAFASTSSSCFDHRHQ